MRNEKAEVRYLQFVDAWYGLDAASARHFYPKAARLGLTRGQPRMLRFLGENDGCRQKDIAEKFYIRAASVSGILSTMEKEGLIERKVNPDSKRETLVYLTELGHEKRKEVMEMYRDLDQEVFAGFDDEDFNRLLELMGRIQDVMEDHSDGDTPQKELDIE